MDKALTLQAGSSVPIYRFKMADKVDLAKGADSFRLCNPPPFLAALNMASLEVGYLGQHGEFQLAVYIIYRALAA